MIPRSPVRIQRSLACVLLGAALLAAQAPRLQAKPEDWKASIEAYERLDEQKAPARGGIVFTGSSTIVMWRSLEADFPGLPVINRGFGGSELPDLTHYADRIVLPYEPRAVVVYSGENDMGAGKEPERLLQDFRGLVARLRAARPGLPIVYIGLRPSPVRWAIRERVQRANALIAAECASLGHTAFVEVYSLMVDGQGALREELFMPDHLHMKPEGYALWRPRVAAALARVLEK